MTGTSLLLRLRPFRNAQAELERRLLADGWQRIAGPRASSLAWRARRYALDDLELDAEGKLGDHGETHWNLTLSVPASMPDEVQVMFVQPASLRLATPLWPRVDCPELMPLLAVASNRRAEVVAFCRRERSWLLANADLVAQAGFSAGRVWHRVQVSGTPHLDAKACAFVAELARRAGGAFSGQPASPGAWDALIRRRRRREWKLMLCVVVGVVIAVASHLTVGERLVPASPAWLPKPLAVAGLLLLAIGFGSIVGWLVSRWALPRAE